MPLLIPFGVHGEKIDASSGVAPWCRVLWCFTMWWSYRVTAPLFSQPTCCAPPMTIPSVRCGTPRDKTDMLIWWMAVNRLKCKPDVIEELTPGLGLQMKTLLGSMGGLFSLSWLWQWNGSMGDGLVSDRYHCCVTQLGSLQVSIVSNSFSYKDIGIVLWQGSDGPRIHQPWEVIAERFSLAHCLHLVSKASESQAHVI